MVEMILLIINFYTQIFEIFISPKRVYNYIIHNLKHLDKLFTSIIL